MEFYKPVNLLNKNNHKTIKGEKKNWFTYIMYLNPHKSNFKGVNLCPKASNGCATACLFNSGNARFKHVQDGRFNKTTYFLSAMNEYMLQLDKEITAIKKKHFKRNQFKIAIRLNGTTDFRFEHLKVRGGKNIFELHPDIQFYDYTKIPQRFSVELPENYHLTFSRSEINDNEVQEVLVNGGNVAVVFDELPKTYFGYEVINGDANDLRFLDKPNVIVGLKYKKNSVKGAKANNDEAFRSGFVVQTKTNKKQVETKILVNEQVGVN